MEYCIVTHHEALTTKVSPMRVIQPGSLQFLQLSQYSKIALVLLPVRLSVKSFLCKKKGLGNNETLFSFPAVTIKKTVFLYLVSLCAPLRETSTDFHKFYLIITDLLSSLKV